MVKKLVENKPFKAKSILNYDNKEYHIEEIQLENKGRLTVNHNNKATEIYFEKADGKLNIAYYDSKSEKKSPSSIKLKAFLFSSAFEKM